MRALSMEIAPILVCAAFGALCALVASSRGRHPLAWFVIGFFFHCIALIVLLVIPDLAAQDAREERLSEENRLLREQLKSHKSVTERRFDENDRRITAHDRALGVDTRSPRRVEAAAAPPPPPPPLPPPDPQATPEKYAVASWPNSFEQRAEGPVTYAGLKDLFATGRVDATTLVWTDGMAGWTPVEQLPGLLESLRA